MVEPGKVLDMRSTIHDTIGCKCTNGGDMVWQKKVFALKRKYMSQYESLGPGII
jgi:hypothetical protein